MYGAHVVHLPFGHLLVYLRVSPVHRFWVALDGHLWVEVKVTGLMSGGKLALGIGVPPSFLLFSLARCSSGPKCWLNWLNAG